MNICAGVGMMHYHWETEDGASSQNHEKLRPDPGLVENQR